MSRPGRQEVLHGRAGEAPEGPLGCGGYMLGWVLSSRAFRLRRIHARMGIFLKGVWPVEDLHWSSRSEYEQE